MMDYQIFISYRWSNSGELAGRIYERLTHKEGYYVFLDEESKIHNTFEIKSCISESRVFILILGEGSFDRCNNKEDILFCEIKQAVEENKHIIIVQTGNFKMPQTLPDEIAPILNLIRLRHKHGDFTNLYNKIVQNIPIQPYGKSMLSFHQDDISKGFISTFTDLNYMKNLFSMMGSSVSLKSSLKDWQPIADNVHKLGTVYIAPLGLFALSPKMYYDYFKYFVTKNGNVRSTGEELIYNIDHHRNDAHAIDVSVLSNPNFKISKYFDGLKHKQLFVYSKDSLIFVLVSAKEYNLFNRLI